MKIQSKFLGEIEIKESDILTFEEGLPGFATYHRFVLLPLDADMPLAVLQSTEEQSVSFIVAYPFAFKSDYTFDLEEEDYEALQIESDRDVVTYTIVTLKDSLVNSTINLLAPIVINIKKKIGRQVVLTNSDLYPLRYPMDVKIGSAK